MAIYLQYNQGERFKIEPTIFPDKTSQVWKISGIEDITKDDKIYIYWVFEEEAELIWLCQLLDLIESYHTELQAVDLIIPYLPYARQDKSISNNSCFAARSFNHLLGAHTANHRIHLLDAHSEGSYEYLVEHTTNHIPYNAIKEIFEKNKYDLILFPDEGAFKRYSQANSMASTHCIKKRNQLTGVIESIIIPDVDFKGKRILIVDDICDGGATFVEIARQLTAAEAAFIGLRVTHGIFSKGVDILYKSEIGQLFRHDYDHFYQEIINES